MQDIIWLIIIGAGYLCTFAGAYFSAFHVYRKLTKQKAPHRRFLGVMAVYVLVAGLVWFGLIYFRVRIEALFLTVPFIAFLPAFFTARRLLAKDTSPGRLAGALAVFSAVFAALFVAVVVLTMFRFGR
jgi:hypothetical protein